VTASWSLLVVLATGCGRLAFDPTEDGGGGDDASVCVPMGHDEDRDTVDDACDVCPHLADPGQQDVDGDRVGDACDPEPSIARQRIAYFDPFTSARPEWSTSGAAPTYDGEDLHFDTVPVGVLVSLDRVPGTDIIRFGARMGDGGMSSRQLTVGAYQDMSHYYYCELYDGGVMTKLGFTYTLDGINFVSVNETTVPGPLDNGTVFVSLDQRTAQRRCETSWPPLTQPVDGADPGGIVGTRFAMVVQGLVIDLEYFVVIRTD
jgi:hypothetical protein